MVNESIRKKYGFNDGFDLFPTEYNEQKQYILARISSCIEEGSLSLKCKFEELKKMPKDLLREQCLIAPAHRPGVPYEDSELCYLDIRNIEELISDDIKKMVSGYQKLPPKQEETKIEMWLCAYPVLCDSGKRYKSKKVTEVGKIINDTWFICSDGTKKRVSAREFEMIKRVDAEEENTIKKKSVYSFPKIDIGAGVDCSYIFVGGSGVKKSFFLEKISLYDQHDHDAYVVEGYDVRIDRDFNLQGEYKHWLKIYNADGIAKEFKADRILVYRYNGSSFVIQLINEVVESKLYKNVDYWDLESIVENGVLSLDECGNDN